MDFKKITSTEVKKKLNFIYAYLYVYTHASYDNNSKIGITTNLHKRLSCFRTGEYEIGKVLAVFVIYKEERYVIDALIKKELKFCWCAEAAGTEFYKIINLDIIEKILTRNNFFFNYLPTDGIEAVSNGRPPELLRNKYEEILWTERRTKETTYSYLYFRHGESAINAICWGITINLRRVDVQFTFKHTGYREFESVFQISRSDSKIISQLLTTELRDYFIFKEPSTNTRYERRYYQFKTVNLIGVILKKSKVSYRKLSGHEILELINTHQNN